MMFLWRCVWLALSPAAAACCWAVPAGVPLFRANAMMANKETSRVVLVLYVEKNSVVLGAPLRKEGRGGEGAHDKAAQK